MIEELYARIQEHIPKMGGWCTPEKSCRIARAIVDSKAALSVELGVFAGRGVISMAMAHQFQEYGVAWGFDPWTAAACCEGTNDKRNDDWWRTLNYENLYAGFIADVQKHGLVPRCYWARLRSDQAVKLFTDGTVDICHADSNHSEEMSCDEIVRWAPKIKKGGYWFADDTDWPTLQKAKKIMPDHGFKLIEDYAKWAIYQKIG